MRNSLSVCRIPIEATAMKYHKIERDFRKHTADNIRAARKVSREYAIWWRQYNNMLIWLAAGIPVDPIALKEWAEKGQSNGWFK